MGCGQPVHHGRIHVPAKSKLQPDRTARCTGLLVGQCNHHRISEAARAADAGVKLFAILVAALIAAPALAGPPQKNTDSLTSEQFLDRCKQSAGFCNLRISFEIASLESNRTACLPGSMPRQS